MRCVYLCTYRILAAVFNAQRYFHLKFVGCANEARAVLREGAWVFAVACSCAKGWAEVFIWYSFRSSLSVYVSYLPWDQSTAALEESLVWLLLRHVPVQPPPSLLCAPEIRELVGERYQNISGHLMGVFAGSTRRDLLRPAVLWRRVFAICFGSDLTRRLLFVQEPTLGRTLLTSDTSSTAQRT